MQMGSNNYEAEMDKLAIRQCIQDDELGTFKQEYLPQSQQAVQINYLQNYDGRVEDWPQFKMSYPESVEASMQRYLAFYRTIQQK